MASPTVSICIPTFNRLTYLQEAVASARAQTSPDIEILIGDDGDSAELRAWCLSQAAEDPRIRYEKTPRRLGLAGNWNFLADHARGEYMVLIGDDDRLLPEFVARLLAGPDRDATVVFSNHFIIDGDGRRLLADSQAMTRRYARAELRAGLLEDPTTLVWQSAVPMMAALVRTREVTRLRFKTDINTPELELFVRMVAEGARFVFVDEYLAEYRMHGGSATTAGLTIDRLAEYLEAVEVPARVERVKEACLAPLLVSGVGIRLGRHDVQGAKRLRASRYYPRSLSPRRLLQGFVLRLPDFLIYPTYASVQRLSRSLRRRAS